MTRRLLAIGLVLALLLSLYTPLFPNLGLPFGYYGKFNRVRRAIEQLPDTQVVEFGLHRDLELEDFWIAARLPDGREVRLTFDNANIRPIGDLLGEVADIDKAPPNQ
jgi:hypothetical protein